MAKHTMPKEISLGLCAFCQGEFAKNKITQHLKTCKARLSASATQDGEKQRLFHLQVEGNYRPGYWMHLEMPAIATLADLDDFLRFVWLECCDHLSEFNIDGMSYSYEPEDAWDMPPGGLSLVKEEDTEEDEEGDAEEGDAEEGQEPDIQEIASEMAKQLSLEFKSDLKNVPAAEIEKKLEQMFAESMPPGMSAGTLPMLRPLLSHLAESLQQGTLAQDLAELGEEDEDEGGMDSELGDILTINKKFSYVYDFGSSSTLSLRLIDEREGAVPLIKDEDLEEEADDDEFEDDGEEIAILIMARNKPPELVCHICGKPASKVPSLSEYDSLAKVALCATHAAKAQDPDELLPIVNSPRTGICGYDGNTVDDWNGEDDEEEGAEEE
ncbi:MAG TPA: hypothetical protein VGD98_21420 [Ktedonobacteraceae bacterium]